MLNLKKEGLGSKWEGTGCLPSLETMEESLSRLVRVLFSVLLQHCAPVSNAVDTCLWVHFPPRDCKLFEDRDCPTFSVSSTYSRFSVNVFDCK